MEAAGLAVGVVGVAGLFSSCLEAVQKIQSYRSSATDSRQLNARFNAARTLFERWGRNVGIEKGKLLADHHPALDDETTSAAVFEILKIVIATPTEAPPLQGPLKTRIRRVAWAFWRKQNREGQVQLFEILVQQLHNLTTRFDSPRPQIPARERRELQDWLGDCISKDSNDRYQDSIRKRLDGTCSWILDQAMFQEWISPDFSAGESEKAKLLWINGGAGFGKTTLCAYIVESLSDSLEMPVAYFFFSSELHRRSDPFIVIQSWISQLASRHQSAYDCARQIWEADRDRIASRNTIADVFTQLLRAVPGCTVIVDGLDECTCLEFGTDNDLVVQFIQILAMAARESKARALIISRDAPVLRLGLAGFAEYKISSQDVHEDVTALSREIVDRKLPNKDEELRSTISKALATRCDGQFLWLRLLEPSLRRSKNRGQLERAIAEAPAEIDFLYNREWNRITRLPEQDRQRAFSLLRWTAFAIRPLTVLEISEAILITDNPDLPFEGPPDALDEDYINEEILGLCGPLLDVSHGVDSSADHMHRTLHIPHFTVQQYLLNVLPTPMIRQSERDRIRLKQMQHTLLAKACLNYVKSSQNWLAPISIMDTLPFCCASFRNYAASCWYHHFKLGIPQDPELCRLAVEFLSESNPTWEPWRALIEEAESDLFEKRVETTFPGPLYYAVKYQLLDVAKAMIKDQSCDVNHTSSLGRSALGVACSTGSADMAGLLLESGASLTVTGKDGCLPIHEASQSGNPKLLKLLLDQGAGIDDLDRKLRTPLHHAVLKNRPSCAQFLLQGGAKLSADSDNMTALHYSASMITDTMAKCLLDFGVPVDTRVKRRTRPQSQHDTKSREDNNADLHDSRIDAEDNRGFTALHYAALSGNRKMTKFLLDHGADPNAVSESGETPLHLGLRRIVNCKQWIGDIWDENNGSIEDLLDLVDPEDDAEVNRITALITDHRLSVIVTLIDHSSTNVNARDDYGASPLHCVNYSCATSSKIVQRLVDKGADVSARNHKGQTPLHLACAGRNPESVAALMDHGADIAAVDLKDLNARQHVANNGSGKAILRLFNEGAT